MSDIKFEIMQRSRTCAAEVARRSTLHALCGKLESDEKLVASVQRLITRRRLCLLHLREAGLACLQDKRYQYARNCPPVVVTVKQDWAHPCKHRFCCFCAARQAIAAFRAVENAVLDAAVRKESVQVVRYSAVYGGKDPHAGIYPWGTGTEPDIGALLRIRHYPTRNTARRQRFSQALGGFYRISCQPRLFDEPTAKDQIGFWEVKHSAVVVVPTGWQPFALQRGSLRSCVDPGSRWLVREVADAFTYPATWMQQHVSSSFVAEMLDRLSDMRLFTRFGIFRNNS